MSLDQSIILTHVSIVVCRDLFLHKLQQQIDHEPDVVKARWLFEPSQSVPDTTYDNTMAKQATPTTSKDEVEDEPGFKTAHNNREEAKKFVKSIVTLVDKFMADITSYDRYKQEEVYTEFVQKYVKELKNFDDYFKDTSPSIILEIIDDKMCEYIRKPPPDLQGIKTHTSEENIPQSTMLYRSWHMNNHLQHWTMLARQLLFSYLQICNLPMSTLPRWPKLWPNSGQLPPLASSALL